MDTNAILEFLHALPRHLSSLFLLVFLVAVGIAFFRDGFMKTVVFNPDSSMRGSFINMVISLGILICIVYGAFSTRVAENLQKMETLIIGFYAISFGVWSGKKYLEKRLGCPEATTDGNGKAPEQLPKGQPPPGYQLMPKE